MSGGASYGPGKPLPPHPHQPTSHPLVAGYQPPPPIVVPASLGVVPQAALANVLTGQPPPPKRQRKERDSVAATNQGRGVARRWNDDEEAHLRRLVDEHGTGKWPTVAERLATGRTPSGVEQHWQIMTGQRKRNCKTTIKDGDMAPPIVPRHHVTSHAALAHGHALHMQERQVTHVAHRWTVDEEARLRALVQEIGKGKWTLIAENLGTGRSASGVEQHWQIMIGQRKRNSSAKTPPKPTLPASQAAPPAPAPTPSPQPGLPSATAPVSAAAAHLAFEQQVIGSAAADGSAPSRAVNNGAASSPGGAVGMALPALAKPPAASNGADELGGTFIF